MIRIIRHTATDATACNTISVAAGSAHVTGARTVEMPATRKAAGMK